MPLDFNLRAFLERLNAFWINYAISSKNRLYDVLGVFNDITVSLFCVWCQNGQSKTWIPRLVFLLALFWTLGNFLEREKGACPLKMHLGNFVRNLFKECQRGNFDYALSFPFIKRVEKGYSKRKWD